MDRILDPRGKTAKCACVCACFWMACKLTDTWCSHGDPLDVIKILVIDSKIQRWSRVKLIFGSRVRICPWSAHVQNYNPASSNQ